MDSQIIVEEAKCQDLFTFPIQQFAQIIELNIPLEALYVLECLIQGTDPRAHIKGHKIEAIEQFLIRKFYLSEKLEVTVLGRQLHSDLRCGTLPIKTTVKRVQKAISTDFERWWAAFPLHDGFDYGGYSFEKTRTLRTKKEDCARLFTKNVNEGPFTAEQIIAATSTHIWKTKVISGRERKNKLSFVHNSETYLRNKDYEAWIADIASRRGKEDEVQEETNSNFDTTVDI